MIKIDLLKNHPGCTYIIYLFGHPGTGKYTISQELMKYDFIVCDNQLINNPIFTLLNYDGYSEIPEMGWDAIGRLRKVVLDFISLEEKHNYVLTNCLYENEGDRYCYSQVESMALKRGSIFVPVKLLISEEENLRRIMEPSRRARWKSIDPKDVHERGELINIEHPNLLELDVSQLSAHQVAKQILENLSTLKNQTGSKFEHISPSPLTGNQSHEKEKISKLELSLLEPAIRKSEEKLDKLIAHDFLEFGSSGKIYNKKDILDSLSSEDTRKFGISHMGIIELSKEVMLVTYQVEENGRVSLRSSIWKRYGNDWRMTFHQGTKVEETAKLSKNRL